MKTRFTSCSQRWGRRGLTLIEIMAGLAILGSLLVALLLARGRCQRQWDLANRRLEAIAAAEALLAQWWQDPALLPRSAAGTLAEPSTLAWRTQAVANGPVESLGAAVVRLEILDRQSRAAVLASVEVVVPGEQSNAN